MARINDLHHTPEVLRVATIWLDQCLINDRSLFFSDELWTASNLSELHSCTTPFEMGNHKNYFEKLHSHLQGADRSIFRLSAEVHWFLYLFPLGVTTEFAYADITPPKKKSNINRILGWVGDKAPENHQLLHPSHLSGVGSSGGQFIRQLYSPHEFFLRTMIELKSKPQIERQSFFQEQDGKAWRLAEFCDSLAGGQNSMMRNAFLFLLLPAHFERIISGEHKRGVVQHFFDLIHKQTAEQLDSVNLRLNPLLVDRAIYEIRQSLEKAYPEDIIDFYIPPVKIQMTENGKQIGEWVSISEIKKRLDRNAQPNAPNEDGGSPETATEGETRFYQYFSKNRKSLRNPKLAAFRAQHGHLFCESCDESGGKYDAGIRDSIFEVHHRKKIADYSDEGEITKLDDLAVLCSNCHNAIHSTPTMLDVEEFGAQVRKPNP